MDKVRVRVSMFADPIEVDPDEVPVLRGQGLLIEDQHTPEPEPDAAPKPARTKPTKES